MESSDRLGLAGASAAAEQHCTEARVPLYVIRESRYAELMGSRQRARACCDCSIRPLRSVSRT